MGEFAELPFEPKRVFTVSEVPPHGLRAGHALRSGTEILVMASGQCTVEFSSGSVMRTRRLDDPSVALLLPPGNWILCREFSAGAVMLVLASNAYQPDDRISDFDEYRALVAATS